MKVGCKGGTCRRDVAAGRAGKTCRQGTKVQREGRVACGGAGASGCAVGSCMHGWSNCTGCQLVDDGSLLRLNAEVKQGYMQCIEAERERGAQWSGMERVWWQVVEAKHAGRA